MHFVVSTPWRPWNVAVCLDSAGQIIESIDFTYSATPPSPHVTSTHHPLKSAIETYFDDPQSSLALPLRARGTAFEKKVWHALTEIPVGETVTYGELARRLSSSPRAVGGACRRNPFVLAVPCHRVVSRGGLGGFVGTTEGDWLTLKKHLLVHECKRRLGND